MAMANQLGLKLTNVIKPAITVKQTATLLFNHCFTHPIALRLPEFDRTRLRCFTTPTYTNPNANNHHNYIHLSDDELLKQCEMGTFKVAGPGGQHRNKRESAVLLKHLPTGIIAQVKHRALSRLILSDDLLRLEVNDLRASKGLKPLK